MGYSNRTFECPFFKWDEKLRVHCEGGRLDFPDRPAAARYMDCCCASVGGWASCTVAANLLHYYERQGR